MINYFLGIVDRRNAFSLFPAGTIVRHPHHRESPTRRERSEPVQNMSSGFAEQCCAVVISTKRKENGLSLRKVKRLS